ncbi:hypothetical protein SASPL_128307 [Salvia splendens]|uniref:Uncharacterized protein n=1 Tax=Salvia splendens TaxID=180675 RepID=A0A8X8XCF5_SALSN|nr:uncharacterized protein LOC121750257 [Salvia splendens]XP_042000696.1 uncharacterized protein LOC121750257 [Salvia splendens]XP_042000697.1 uncharacterized protein LOC121750257 [Salvia splendens]KAG6410254.1 hypothetical protein SASPL_128307 [Salvia splendens]
MPGNELGDRVHNFFAQDNSSQGQHQTHGLEGNWPVPNNNFWVGSPRPVGVVNSSTKSYSGQNPEIDRGHSSYPVHAAHGLNFSQSNLRPDFSRSQSLNEQQYSNGHMYGNQYSQGRQNEENFRELDAYSNQHNILASRGLPVHELQRISGREQLPNSSDRSGSSVSSVSFDLFGGQQQMNHQQASLLQALQRQQSGLNDMHQLQQQLMIRKMEELQRQQQLQQLDSRPQNPNHQVPQAAKQASGSQSPMFHGTLNSDALRNPWTTEPGTNWLGRGSAAIQGSPSGINFLPNLGQTHQLIDMVNQQADQSLYGVPVSNSRGLGVNQYSTMVTERPPLAQMPTSGNSLYSNQHNFLPDRLTEGTSISRQNFQNETNEHGSSQAMNTGLMDIGFHQQVNSLQNNAKHQDHARKRELSTVSETSQERYPMQVSSPQNEVTLDPAEEKILYGSDDSIWSAFGKLPSISGEAGSLFDSSSGISNGIPSLNSGSWSALMQSAVAETSSADIGRQEEWSSLNYHKDGSLATPPPLIHNGNVKQSPLTSDSVRIPSGKGTESIHSSDPLRPMGLNQLGHTLLGQPIEAVPTDVSKRFGQSVAGTSKWLNRSQVQNQLTGETDIRGNALEKAVGAERNGKKVFADWPPGQGGTKPQSNGWNALAAVPPAGGTSLNSHNAEKVSQNQNNQVRAMQGQMVDGDSLWKSSPLTSAVEFGSVRSMTGNHQANNSEGNLGFHSAAYSVANSCNMVAGDGANPFARNNYLLNQWKHASPSTKSQGGESLGRMIDPGNDQNQGSRKSPDNGDMINYDRENCAMKENSNDSHRSNLSNHASGGLRESGAVDAIDSRSLSSGKQKLSNQLAKKGSAPRKFHYHPMGNLDDDVGPTHDLKQPTQAQATALQNAHPGQLNLFGQVPINSAEKGEIPKDSKHHDKEPSGGSFTAYAAGTSTLFSQSFDSSTNKVTSPSQNMLELLHKVDVSSQPPEAENSDGSAGHLQRSQSSFSKGFGLQLGPPSQLLQIPDLSSPSQKAQSMANAACTSLASIGMAKNSMHMSSSFQSRQSPNEKSQMEYENHASAGPRNPGNDNSVSKGPGNYHSAFTSDTPYMQSQLQNKQATRPNTKPAMNQHIDSSFSYSASHSMERGSAETVLPDTSGNHQKNSLPSSGGSAQQSGPYDVQEIGPAGTASSRDQMRGSQHFAMSSMSRQGSSSQILNNMWSNVPTPQNTSAAQYPTNFNELPQPNILESSSRGDLDVGKGGHICTKSTAMHVDGHMQRLKENSGEVVSASKIDMPSGSASYIKNHLDDSPANSASTQKDIEYFGRSLKPNSFTNENFSLLNQMSDLKNAESDPSIRFSKKLKGPENVHDIHQSHLVTEKQNYENFRNSLGSSSGIPPEDSRVVTFSTPSDMMLRNTSPHRNAVPEDVSMMTALHDSTSKPPADASAVRVEHHAVSPQMAPSWFNQYGSLKSGPLLPMQNMCHVMSSRPEELPISTGMSSMGTPYLEDKIVATPVEAYVGGALKSCVPTIKANEHLFSPPSMKMNVSDQHQVILRPKKRKTATSELLSWYKEITHCSQSPSILSLVEANWSRAVNRLTEKVEDEIDLIEDGPPLLRSKRRLILTTQLMQQLFCPPPATVLSADAISEYESLAYAVSRVALGDACSALSTSSNLDSPRHDMNIHAVKGKLNGGPCFAKVIEDLLGKAGKLENDLLRLDKTASILDLRLECQDLEKFSVINRFAKFHGRGQTDNAVISTDATTATQKPCAQRYITAVPMPKSLPDWVQCLSL